MSTHRPWKVRAFFWGFALGAGGYITIMGLALFVHTQSGVEDAVFEGVLLLSKPVALLVPPRKHDVLGLFLLLLLLVPYWGAIGGGAALGFTYTKRSILIGWRERQGRCTTCGYLLRELPSNKCPECSTEFKKPLEENATL